jgi:hypothetical protein
MGPGLDPPGKAMTEKVMAAPAPRSPDTAGLTEGAGDGLRCLPSPDKAQAPMGRRGGTAFIDFGRNKVFAVTDDSDEVLVFNNLTELVEKLRPAVIVLDSLPGKFQVTAAELAKTGITFLRLKDLKKLSEERKNNGTQKSDENDVIMLKTLYRNKPDIFQPLFETPEELTVRTLTELWVQEAFLKKVSKQARTTISHPVATEIQKTHRRHVKRLAEEIHREALKLPLYRLGDEKLGLRGPALAYLLSHDGWAFKTLNSDRLQVRYQLVPLRHRRSQRSRLLIMLANTAVLNNHPRYRPIFEKYMERFQGQRYAYWKAVLRVARRILRDLRLLANGQEPWTPTG